MPTLPPIPEWLIPFIAIVIAPISGWLNSNNLPKWANRVISGIIVLAFAFICSYLTHSLSSDLALSFMAIAGFTYFLLRGPLAFLHEWLLLKTPSPLGFLAPGRIVDSETRYTPSVQPPDEGQFHDRY